MQLQKDCKTQHHPGSDLDRNWIVVQFPVLDSDESLCFALFFKINENVSRHFKLMLD